MGKIYRQSPVKSPDIKNTLDKIYTITAREPSIYLCKMIKICSVAPFLHSGRMLAHQIGTPSQMVSTVVVTINSIILFTQPGCKNIHRISPSSASLSADGLCWVRNLAKRSLKQKSSPHLRTDPDLRPFSAYNLCVESYFKRLLNQNW